MSEYKKNIYICRALLALMYWHTCVTLVIHVRSGIKKGKKGCAETYNYWRQACRY
jgi:hypothetical protein